jgi:hypothetical protein
MYMKSFTDGGPPAAAELQPAALQLVCLFNELTFVNLYLYEVLSTVAFKAHAYTGSFFTKTPVMVTVALLDSSAMVTVALLALVTLADL